MMECGQASGKKNRDQTEVPAAGAGTVVYGPESGRDSARMWECLCVFAQSFTFLQRKRKAFSNPIAPT